MRTIGDGPQVVVIPLAYWNQDQFERIAQGRTFVFYDPRGRRRSTPVKGPSEFGIDADLADLDPAAVFGALNPDAIRLMDEAGYD